METFEWIILLLVCAAGLAELARRIGAPYPTLLALGGAALALIPDGPRWVLDPELALTLFVAPVLLDAAYDTSLRDLRANWRPVTGLVIAAVASTVLGVAVVCRWLLPDMPWAIAIALGAIVAPPDAAAATAVMRQVGLPHRLMSILEGESLLNDASALIIYRLALAAAIGGPLGLGDLLPTLLLTLVGSVIAGLLIAKVLRPVLGIPQHAPTSLILQFALTFGVWVVAEKAGLSGILTMVTFAMAMARGGGPQMPARMRVPIWAVWETAVFVLNAMAFVLIGLQLQPIWERLGTGAARLDAMAVAMAVLVTAIVTRFLWVLTYGALASHHRRHHRHQPLHNPPSGGHWRQGVVVAWSGMRGIVTLAAAFAIPQTLPNGQPFPYRDLILLCAFTVVFGTLVLQGVTMKAIIRRLAVRETVDPVAREVRIGRVEIYKALLASVKDNDSLHARLLAKEYQAIIELNADPAAAEPLHEVPGGMLRRQAITTARERAIDLRNRQVIGEQAYRALIQELDWAELAAGGTG
ncbi:MAG: Na+/H+ antiporter [Pelomonas sp.]|nr:Na+/H+ antiporter [Roseateles sp.]